MLSIFGCFKNPVYALTNEVLLEAEDGIESDLETGNIIATNHVRIARNGLVILADKVQYNQLTGALTATGHVTITEKNISYETEVLTYNIKTKEGSSSFFHGKITDPIRDGFFRGAGFVTSDQITNVKEIAFTRCALSNPHYQLKAKRAIITEKAIKLKHVVLTLYGVPIFYFPSFSIKSQKKKVNKDLEIDDAPDLMAGYDSTSGIWLQYQYHQTLNDYFALDLSGKVATETKAAFNLGVGYTKNLFSNHLNLGIEWEKEPTVENVLRYDLPSWNFSLSEWHSFAATNTNKLGVNLTRKYFETPLGKWQLGVSGYHVAALEEEENYGGSYGVTRLDYQPFAYLNLNYLWTYSFVDQNNYHDLGPDTTGAPNGGDNFGSSLGAALNVPFGNGFILGGSSSYNLDREELLKLDYNLNYENCCYKWLIGYDQIGKKWQLTGALKF